MLGGAGLAGLAGNRLAFAQGLPGRNLVVIILRGALDGLAAVIPYHERQLMSLRSELVPPAPGSKGGALELGAGGFALHPSLGFIHSQYQAGQLAIMHAAASPYRARSHFDGQDVLESGAYQVYEANSGWLNRALLKAPTGQKAAAVGPALPLLLRGDAKAVSWAPSTLPEPDDDTFQRLMRMYENDKALATALSGAKTLGMSAGEIEGDARAISRGRSYAPLMQAGANLIASEGAGVVVLSLTGWDTHAGQGAGTGALARRLQQLDEGLAAMKVSLGAQWDRTAVLVTTEFGRTVRVNGSKGSDHGTGAAAFLLGGAVKGGLMLGDWPGLENRALYEGRDLYPANDLRALFKGVCRDHLGVTRTDLDRSVFPRSSAVAPLEDLISA
jgi:uncharacterized protein (DUF1501 family)